MAPEYKPVHVPNVCDNPAKTLRALAENDKAFNDILGGLDEITATAAVTTLSPGDPATAGVVFDNGVFEFDFGIPPGADGVDGADGADGAPGAPGADGADGADGISPTLVDDPPHTVNEVASGSPLVLNVTVTDNGGGEYGLNFELDVPRGNDGDPGVTPTIDADASATSVPYGDPATCTLTVTEPTPDNYHFQFDFEIPEGEPGDDFIPGTTEDVEVALDGGGSTILHFVDGIYTGRD